MGYCFTHGIYEDVTAPGCPTCNLSTFHVGDHAPAPDLAYVDAAELAALRAVEKAAREVAELNPGDVYLAPLMMRDALAALDKLRNPQATPDHPPHRAEGEQDQPA